MIGVFVSLSYNGVHLDLSPDRYRSYSNIFGIKIGKWQSLRDFGAVSILRREDSYRADNYAMPSLEESSIYTGSFW